MLALEKRIYQKQKSESSLFSWSKNKRFLLLLFSSFAEEKHNITLHSSTNDAPYKNEGEIYKELTSIKDFYNIHLQKKHMYISAPTLRLDNKNANSILKKYVAKLNVVYKNSVILHDSILSSHLNKDGMHLNSYDTAIKLAESFI